MRALQASKHLQIFNLTYGRCGARISAYEMLHILRAPGGRALAGAVLKVALTAPLTGPPWGELGSGRLTYSFYGKYNRFYGNYSAEAVAGAP